MDSTKKPRRSLDPEELNTIKNNLIQRRKALWNEIVHDLETDVNQEHREVLDILREQGDMALEELRESTAFTIIELKHNEITLIEEALERMEKGEYGLCVDCKRVINPERLKAVPYAIRCRRCQAEHEKLK